MSCCCCDCLEGRVATKDSKKKDKQKANDIEKNSLNQSTDTSNTFSMIEKDIYSDDINLEDYYFRRPVINKYSNNELYSMDIAEIYLGFHPTIFKDKNNKFEPSFHPFFYLKLTNEDDEYLGVVVQYNIVPKDAQYEQIHLYEEEGVEFIEKSIKEFEREIKIIYHLATGVVFNINEHIVKYSYSSKQFPEMTLGEFFQKAIPEKGVWLQRYLKKLQKTCFEFCLSTIQKIGVKKKKKNAITDIKENIKNLLDRSYYAKYYERYNKGFELLFDEITEKDN